MNFFKKIHHFIDKREYIHKVFLPLSTTLMYIYSVNLKDGNMLVSLLALFFMTGIFFVDGIYLGYEMKGFKSKPKAKQIFDISMMIIIISAIGVFCFLQYQVIITIIS
jgi:hypothetical protein